MTGKTFGEATHRIPPVPAMSLPPTFGNALLQIGAIRFLLPHPQDEAYSILQEFAQSIEATGQGAISITAPSHQLLPPR